MTIQFSLVWLPVGILVLMACMAVACLRAALRAATTDGAVGFTLAACGLLLVLTPSSIYLYTWQCDQTRASQHQYAEDRVNELRAERDVLEEEVRILELKKQEQK